MLGSYHFFFLNKNITPLEMNSDSFRSNRGEFTPTLTYRRNKSEGGEDDSNLYTIVVSNYPIFHTGSHGTIVFKWDNRGKLDYQTYDYDKEKIYSQDLLDSPLRPTTKMVFFKTDYLDQSLFRIIGARQYSCLGVRIYQDPNFLAAMLKDERFSYLQAIYLERSNISKIDLSLVEKLLKKLIHLQVFSIRKDQLSLDYEPTFLEKRFLGIE